MSIDFYVQPHAPDPVLSTEQVLTIARQHAPTVQAVTGVEESGGEARTYLLDADLLLKVQRPQQLRPRTSLAKEVAILQALAKTPGITVPHVLGYGREEQQIEYTLMSRMPGRAFRQVNPTGAMRYEALVALGRMLRVLHAIPQEPLLATNLFPGDHTFVDVSIRLGRLFNEMLALMRERQIPWHLPQTPEQIAAATMLRLPVSQEHVILHSNPGPEHVFVDPVEETLIGIIDFGDAYISHPTFDMRRWYLPADRTALLEGYTHAAPVSDAFLGTWRVMMVLANFIVMASYPERADAAQQDILTLLEQA